MRHLDLFSGIGGFAYAADVVFGDVEHIFCDNNEYCRAVLRKHWPESEIYHDIRAITADADADGAGPHGKDTAGPTGLPWAGEPVDLLTGGFPCQPFSAAGLRRGTADDRHLWPEMLRVIQATKPEWIIGENVRGITNWNDGVVFEQVCADMEASGYEVQPFIIPAVGVNAPHRRDRVWFIGHAPGRGNRAVAGNPGGAPAAQRLQERDQMEQRVVADSLRDAPDTGRERRGPGSKQAVRSEEPQPVGAHGDFSNWERDWHEVAAEFCSVDDGLPAELDGLKLSKAQHRNEQLKAYGNAIVPQVAMELMMAMKEASI